MGLIYKIILIINNFLFNKTIFSSQSFKTSFPFALAQFRSFRFPPIHPLSHFLLSVSSSEYLIPLLALTRFSYLSHTSDPFPNLAHFCHAFRGTAASNIARYVHTQHSNLRHWKSLLYFSFIFQVLSGWVSFVSQKHTSLKRMAEFVIK